MKSDGVFWASGRMGAVRVNEIWNTYGSVFYKKDATNVLLQCNVVQNVHTSKTQSYEPPYLMAGSMTNYVGTFIDGDIKYMYLCEDVITGGFTITDGPKTPYNTSISTTSYTDGFFSCGKDDISGRAAVAKLSTCVNFKIPENDLPPNNLISVEYTPSISIALPLNYEGAKAPNLNGVTYSLGVYVESGTVNGITPNDNGGELENLTNQVVDSYAAGAGKVLDLNRTYTLGASPIVIKYVLSIKDSYQTAGIPQSCGQTYIFRVQSVPQIDVVAMPKLNAKTNKINLSLKNIGSSSFAAPFNITVYKDAEGATDKYVYSYPSTIAYNQTVHLEIDTSTLIGATKYIISVNDAGTGEKDQPEINKERFVYEVNSTL